ncbi:cysteine dioxygenase [Xylophilus rhododendri]|uniref:Cysteine dioxygenase n=1 Tax=Xylophilus rhododendri TaxID=2697032 RepID=A0A857J773_9BURK|nr:cysteine dioxygenase family protein [Xylophilus rhododendri]QHI99093.1 cysteine dioxygenase [Xylophilus rhododendri]
MTAASPEDLRQARRGAVADTLADIRRLSAAQIDRAALDRIAARLAVLAARAELFSRADFPPPAAEAGVGASTRYRLNPDDGDEDIALYLNSINPGKKTIPHNHDTWAVIVAIEGQEFNRVYRRVGQNADGSVIRLEVERELTVEPGTPIAFLAQDLHSIHVAGDTPTLHFHLYGRPLETLTGRIGVDPDTGAVVNYNATQMKPSEAAAA